MILRLAKKQDLLKYAGILSKERGEELEEAIKDSRKSSQKRYT